MLTYKYFCTNCGTLFSETLKEVDQYDPLFQLCPYCGTLKVLKVKNEKEVGETTTRRG